MCASEYASSRKDKEEPSSTGIRIEQRRRKYHIPAVERCRHDAVDPPTSESVLRQNIPTVASVSGPGNPETRTTIENTKLLVLPVPANRMRAWTGLIASELMDNPGSRRSVEGDQLGLSAVALVVFQTPPLTVPT